MSPRRRRGRAAAFQRGAKRRGRNRPCAGLPTAAPSEPSPAPPTQRDRHLQAIKEQGRMAWQKGSGYNWRALVEADVSRFKRVVGDGLRSRTDRRRSTEVAIAVSALNRMLDLGRPEYSRIV